MKKTLLALASVITVTGCASNKEYEMYVEAHRARATAQAAADVARYQALAEIARSGDTASKVAAVISLNMQGQQGTAQQPMIAAPKSTAETVLQFSSLLVPQLTQIYAINKQAATAITQSNNATALGVAQAEQNAATAIATTSAFVSIAGQIQSPAANVTTTTTTTSTDSSNRSTNNTTTAGRDLNSGANSGNTGNIAGQGVSNNTATPTVVTQPAPIIVQQPTPVIVQPTVVTQPPPVIVQPAPPPAP